MVLSDFDASQLSQTIPDFRNTIKHYAQLEAQMAADPVGRAQEVRAEVDWLRSVKEKACCQIALAKDMLQKLPQMEKSSRIV